MPDPSYKGAGKRKKTILLGALALALLLGGIFAFYWMTKSRPAGAVSLPEYTNSIGMKFKLIPAGTFEMGTADTLKETIARLIGEKMSDRLGIKIPHDFDDEKPQHTVKITKPFYMGIHEVTQEQYEKVMGENPSYFINPNRPVEHLFWYNAVAFCEKLSSLEGTEYRLPTEAEWEYACRAGTDTAHYWGDEINGDFCWYSDNSGNETHDVGQKKPNSWGLYDMSGNVLEWCADRYGPYSGRTVIDPVGPASGGYSPSRGGSCCFPSSYCRSAWRGCVSLGESSWDIGFRLVLVPGTPPK